MSTAPEAHDGVATSARLLPLSKDPFQAPTDRDMLPSERRLFVQTHRTCVFGYGRRPAGPAMSILSYVPDNNADLLVATMADRAKAKAVARNGKVSLCVLDESWPFTYLQVYCDAVLDDDGETLVDVMMAVAERMSGEALGTELRPMVKAMGEEEGRVLLRCRPYASFVTPPRHLHRNDQEERLTHWVSASMAWDAAVSSDAGGRSDSPTSSAVRASMLMAVGSVLRERLAALYTAPQWKRGFISTIFMKRPGHLGPALRALYC